jgi:hypothetical protein
LQVAFEATVCLCRSGKAVMKTIVDELRIMIVDLLDDLSPLSCPLDVPMCACGGFARMEKVHRVVDAEPMTIS